MKIKKLCIEKNVASKCLMILNTAIIHSKISYEENIDSFVVSMSEEPNNVP